MPNLLPIRPASTIALLRPGIGQPEVLLLQRTYDAVFMPGCYVFPGGAVDEEDNQAALAAMCHGQTTASANALLNTNNGLGWLIAAVRESFEESGLLLAQDGNGNSPTNKHPVMAQRDAVATGEIDLLTLCHQHQLTLNLSGIRYIDRWITPAGPPRRFDARFFLAEAPANQTARHDGDETIDSLWISAADALQRHQQAKLPLAPPTLAVLQRLNQFDSLQQALDYQPRVATTSG